jgi:site-specific DNA-methyltransferase (adenine-specific)
MSILLHGDCLEHMKDIDNDSIDFIFCDLPYGQTSCKWDCCIDLEKFWIEVMRIKKINTPIFMTTTTKFGVSLINSAPKKCPFRYDLVWVKSAPAGFLSAKKMPMRKHEMVYVFYEKLPLYDLSSHTHKFIKETVNKRNGKDGVDNKEPNTINTLYGDEVEVPDYVNKRNKKTGMSAYEPPLPVSVVKEDYETCNKPKRKMIYGNMEVFEPKRRGEPRYDPPLPTTMLEIKSTKGKHSTQKPVELMEWLLKYFSKEGDTVLDPTMGSGSTGVACKNMNRNFIGIELDPEIYEVAVNRIEE